MVKKMTKASKKVATSKKVTTLKNGVDIDAVNESLVTGLTSCFSLEAELDFYIEAVGLMNEGMLSVRGLKATIEEAEKVGSAPTIKASHAQDFMLSSKVRALKGGEGQTLRTIFNLCVQGRKALGGVNELTLKIAKAKDFDSLASQIKSSQAKRKAGKETADEKKAGKVAKVATPDELIKALAQAFKEGAHVSSLKVIESFSPVLKKEIAYQVAKGNETAEKVA